jgi:hypothetical protein
MISWVIISLLAAAAPARPLALSCVGTDAGFHGDAEWRKSLHIDLVNGSFCFDDCRAEERIRTVTGSRFTLWDRGAEGWTSDNSPVRDIATWDSATGAFTREYAWNGRIFHAGTVRAVCRPVSDRSRVRH